MKDLPCKGYSDSRPAPVTRLGNLDAYADWQTLVAAVEKILREFGENYVINFA